MTYSMCTSPAPTTLHRARSATIAPPTNPKFVLGFRDNQGYTVLAAQRMPYRPSGAEGKGK